MRTIVPPLLSKNMIERMFTHSSVVVSKLNEVLPQPSILFFSIIITVALVTSIGYHASLSVGQVVRSNMVRMTSKRSTKAELMTR